MAARSVTQWIPLASPQATRLRVGGPTNLLEQRLTRHVSSTSGTSAAPSSPKTPRSAGLNSGSAGRFHKGRDGSSSSGTSGGEGNERTRGGGVEEPSVR